MPRALATASGVRKSASSVARPSSRRRVAIGSGTSAAWISPESIAPRRPRPPRLMRWSWAMLTPARASSQPNQASSGAPGVVTPTRSPCRRSIDRTALVCSAATSTANGGAAVSANTSRGVWPGLRGPKRSSASSVVALRSTWPWANAARAVAALRARRLLTPARLAALGEAAVARVIRAAGTPRVKARRLRALTRWLLDRFGGAFAPMRRLPLVPLRRELLGVPGIGPETADAILLYAAARPVFVADAYARRVLVRHRLLRRGAGYDEARAFLEARLPSDPVLFNEFHALLVRVGKTHCRTVPRCEGCPLRFDLQSRGPAR